MHFMYCILKLEVIQTECNKLLRYKRSEVHMGERLSMALR